MRKRGINAYMGKPRKVNTLHKPTEEQANEMLNTLNNFMKDFNIDEIQFGKKHAIQKTDGEQAQPVIKKKR